jgi:hypothetical protein
MLQRSKPLVQRHAISKVLNSIIERRLLRHYRRSGGGLVCYRGLGSQRVHDQYGCRNGYDRDDPEPINVEKLHAPPPFTLGRRLLRWDVPERDMVV